MKAIDGRPSSTQGFAAFALVGPGRAGTALSVALLDAGSRAVGVAGRAPDAPSTRRLAARLGARTVEVTDAGRGADLVVIATPDAAIEAVAAALAPSVKRGALVVHLSGARGLDALAPLADARPDVLTGALHPLQTLPALDRDDDRPLAGAWAAVAGTTAVDALAHELGLRPFRVDDADRAAYHATACVASNHLVALLGQVERLAATAGIPPGVLAPLIRASVENALSRGAADALTGPVARGDIATVAAHLAALPEGERNTYRALATDAHRLGGRDDAELGALLEGISA